MDSVSIGQDNENKLEGYEQIHGVSLSEELNKAQGERVANGSSDSKP